MPVKVKIIPVIELIDVDNDKLMFKNCPDDPNIYNICRDDDCGEIILKVKKDDLLEFAQAIIDNFK